MSASGWFLLGLPAAFFAGMGVCALVAPTFILRLFGVDARSPEGRTEVRAVYGGFGLSVAAVLLFAGALPGPEGRGVLLAVSAAAAGMALGRVWGLLAEPRQRPFPTWLFLGVEVWLAASLWFAARHI